MTELAVVGGASGALGSAVVRRLRAERLRVVAVARTATALATLAGEDPGVIPCVGDLADDTVIDTIAAAIDSPVRIVVQAAGLPAAGDIDTLTGEELARGVNVKVGGLLRLVQATRSRFVPGTRVVVLGGHYGYEPSPHAPLAGAVNAVLANVVRSLADRHGPDGVTVHLVAPGPVDSPRMMAIAARAAERRGVTDEDVLAEYRAASPLGRLTTIDEVAWAVGLLLAPEAAALHGSTLSLDAGRRRGIG